MFEQLPAWLSMGNYGAYVYGSVALFIFVNYGLWLTSKRGYQQTLTALKKELVEND